MCTHTFIILNNHRLFYFPANQTPQHLSVCGRCRPHMPSWKLFEYYTKVNFTLGFPPPICSMLFSSNKVHCGANLPNYR